MAKANQAVSPVNATAPVAGIVSHIKARCDALVNCDRTTIEAEKEAGRKAYTGLQGVRLVFGQSAEAITSVNWDSSYSVPMQEALEGSKLYKDANSIKVVKARHKVTAIGLSNGIEPLEGEGERAYAARVLPIVKERGFFAPSNRGGAQAGNTKASKVTNVTRDAGLAAICGTDLVLRQAVDYLVKNHADKILALYAELSTKDGKTA